MNKREKDVLKLTEDFRDTLQNDLVKQQNKNKREIIKDIKLVGTTKSNGNVFVVEKEIVDIDASGNKRRTRLNSYYLDKKCIAGSLGAGQMVYSDAFREREPERIREVEELMKTTTREAIDSNSLVNLKQKEKQEVMQAFTNQIPQDDLEHVKVSSLQKINLKEVVDGEVTLGKKLDLGDFDSIYIGYSENVQNITLDKKRNPTTFSLVGMTNEGEIEVLNDEFEKDRTVGSDASRLQTKVRADNTATRDNFDLSVYRRKSNGMSLGVERNSKGNIDTFLYQKTLEENENMGIQIRTDKTPIIPLRTRELMNSRKGMYQIDNIQDEVEKHTDKGCKPDDIKDFDGKQDTMNHVHLDECVLQQYVEEVYNHENSDGEKIIKDVFSEDDVREKIVKELTENKDDITVEEKLQKIKDEMNQDAGAFYKEHKL